MRLNLRKRRDHLNLTQEEVAIRVGIARNTYTNIELGTKNPSLEVALKIKSAIDYFDDDIFLNLDVPEWDETKETA